MSTTGKDDFLSLFKDSIIFVPSSKNNNNNNKTNNDINKEQLAESTAKFYEQVISLPSQQNK